MESKAVFLAHMSPWRNVGSFFLTVLTHQRILGTVWFYLYLCAGFTYVFLKFPLRLLGKWSNLTSIVYMYDCMTLFCWLKKTRVVVTRTIFVTVLIVGVVFSYLHGYLQPRVNKITQQVLMSRDTVGRNPANHNPVNNGISTTNLNWSVSRISAINSMGLSVYWVSC